MIRIRKEQFDILADAMVRDWILSHVFEQFPKIAAAIGPHEISFYIDSAIDESRAMGFDTAKDMASYVDLVLLFGHQFPLREAWAREALAKADEDSSLPPEGRMRLLYDAALLSLRSDEPSAIKPRAATAAAGAGASSNLVASREAIG